MSNLPPPALLFLTDRRPGPLNLDASTLLRASDDFFRDRPFLFDWFFPAAAWAQPGSDAPVTTDADWQTLRDHPAAIETVQQGYCKLAACCGFVVDHHGFVFRQQRGPGYWWAARPTAFDQVLARAHHALVQGRVRGYSTTQWAPSSDFRYAPPLRRLVTEALREARSAAAAEEWLRLAGLRTA